MTRRQMRYMALTVVFILFSITAVFAEDTKMTSFLNGIEFDVPYGCEYNTSIEEATIRLDMEDGSIINIYSEDLRGIGPEEYVHYSNKNIEENKGGFRLNSKETINLEDGRVLYDYYYDRGVLSNIENDKNVYYERNVYSPQFGRVVTIWLKTDSIHFEENKLKVVSIYNSLGMFEKTKPVYEATYKEREISLLGKDFDLEIPSHKMLWGIMNPHSMKNESYFNNLKPLEDQLDWKFEFLMTYSDFENRPKLEYVEEIYDDKRVLMVTLQPWFHGDRDNNIIIPEIIEGKYDDYLRQWADELESLENPVFVRFANEMNGDWDPWCNWFYGKDYTLYNKAWERVYNIIKVNDNIQFVWNPHDRSYPDFKWNNAHLYYPGDEYVDWVGITGYNNGTSYEGDVWREISQIYYPMYNEYMSHYSEKPFMITEFSSNEVGGDKSLWIRNGFNEFAHMPNIKIAVWFNKVDMLWQYNLDSTPESMEAFKDSIRYQNSTFKAIFEKQEVTDEQ